MGCAVFKAAHDFFGKLYYWTVKAARNAEKSAYVPRKQSSTVLHINVHHVSPIGLTGIGSYHRQQFCTFTTDVEP